MKKLFPAFFLLITPTVAFAQQKPEPQNGTQSAIAFWHYSRCVVDSAPERIAELLSHFPWTSGDFEVARKLAVTRRDCLMPGDSLAFRSDLLQGAFASALLVKKYAHGVFPDFAKFPFAFGVEGLAGLDGDARKRYISLVFAECVFRTNPAATLAVLREETFSAADTTAFTELGSTMSACLPLQTGDQVKFTRSALRNFLGIASYESDKRVTSTTSAGAH